MLAYDPHRYASAPGANQRLRNRVTGAGTETVERRVDRAPRVVDARDDPHHEVLIAEGRVARRDRRVDTFVEVDADGAGRLNGRRGAGNERTGEAGINAGMGVGANIIDSGRREAVERHQMVRSHGVVSDSPEFVLRSRPVPEVRRSVVQRVPDNGQARGSYYGFRGRSYEDRSCSNDIARRSGKNLISPDVRRGADELSDHSD